MVFALVCVLTAAFGRLFRTIWFYPIGYGIKIHNIMFLLIFYIDERYVLPWFGNAKVFPATNLKGSEMEVLVFYGPNSGFLARCKAKCSPMAKDNLRSNLFSLDRC